MIRNDIKDFVSTIPNNVTLVAASKYMDVNDLYVLLNAGITHFGENRVDSFLNKYTLLKQNKDITWHFIGHLQRNKAKDIINKIDSLDSLDSLELAKIISNSRIKPLKCLVEVSINGEVNKNGIDPKNVCSFILEASKLPNIKIEGLMMMALDNSSPSSLEEQFGKLTSLRDKLEKELSISLPRLSMGMSNDYIYAIKKGSSEVRLGKILLSK